MANLAAAADALKQGELVVLPTETVYGLAADATNPAALQKIFDLKGRPSDNPLIVHLADFPEAQKFAREIPDAAYALADACYPGPLSIVLKKQPSVSDLITAGGDTVAVRVPDHSIPLALMDVGEVALAMPSANPFMGLSPTSAEAVSQTILNGVWGIIDGGPCFYGVESTVVDVTGSEPVVLRPGIITVEEISDILKTHVTTQKQDSKRRSPGQYRRHYAPRTPCELVESIGDRPGITFGAAGEGQIQLPGRLRDCAKMLYAALADMDSRGLPAFFIEIPPTGSEWEVIHDRLLKATAQPLE